MQYSESEIISKCSFWRIFSELFFYAHHYISASSSRHKERRNMLISLTLFLKQQLPDLVMLLFLYQNSIPYYLYLFFCVIEQWLWSSRFLQTKSHEPVKAHDHVSSCGMIIILLFSLKVFPQCISYASLQRTNGALYSALISLISFCPSIYGW